MQESNSIPLPNYYLGWGEMGPGEVEEELHLVRMVMNQIPVNLIQIAIWNLGQAAVEVH